MKQPFFSAVLANSVLALFSFACLGASPRPLTEGKKEEPPKKEAGKPVVVSAETLAQAGRMGTRRRRSSLGKLLDRRSGVKQKGWRCWSFAHHAAASRRGTK